ncbi:uncharacterized protein LOC134189877 [Corticium candelabrum]|uniref:uncharacterized protein LOC134189877 n=1 Tax=Corticium candelabrum TaxID=121492 RepID=UPI002E25B99F|nr:uncharacterized protein LOC134189877 [Corticium candelabrum]
MLITGGCSSYFEVRFNFEMQLPEYRCPLEPATAGVWMYDPASVRWLRLISQPAYRDTILGPTVIVWNDLLLYFGGIPTNSLSSGDILEDWSGFYMYRPACPPGTQSADIMKYACSDCSVGSYAATSNSNCSRCPHGLTTLDKASTSNEMCRQCVPGYCGHGTCTVTLASQARLNSGKSSSSSRHSRAFSSATARKSLACEATVTLPGPEPNCLCQFGFTNDEDGLCTVPTYYMAGLGFLAGVVLLALVAVMVAKFRRTRRNHDDMIRHKEQELIELTNSWNIDSKELALRQRIDRDSPGGYGEVYQAEYREMIVAVKKLQGIHQHLDRIELEFEREIEVMRTIRHPNIVLFLGGGRYHDDGCPFLVVEYMARGSLAAILKNEDIELEDSLKLRFTLEAAKGLRFLHGQRPPRVHRDLKSGNLLVSQRWVVKVADFGAARLVREEGKNQESVRGEGRLDPEAPLLHADYQLSLCVGTPHWCAPEILCADNYGTPADVYSFGIVMWEIWSRKVPYEDCHFRSVIDLKSAVLRGVRPTISDDTQNDYVNFMRRCWAADSAARPSFQEVVFRIDDMIEGDALVSEERQYSGVARCTVWRLHTESETDETQKYPLIQ